MGFQKSTYKWLINREPLSKRSVLVRIVYTTDIPKKNLCTHYRLVEGTPLERREPTTGEIFSSVGRAVAEGGIGREGRGGGIWGFGSERFERGAKGFE